MPSQGANVDGERIADFLMQLTELVGRELDQPDHVLHSKEANVKGEKHANFPMIFQWRLPSLRSQF